MLYSFGDSRRPRLETAILVDHIGKVAFFMDERKDTLIIKEGVLSK